MNSPPEVATTMQRFPFESSTPENPGTGGTPALIPTDHETEIQSDTLADDLINEAPAGFREEY
jgi:hypothetical protein